MPAKKKSGKARKAIKKKAAPKKAAAKKVARKAQASQSQPASKKARSRGSAGRDSAKNKGNPFGYRIQAFLLGEPMDSCRRHLRKRTKKADQQFKQSKPLWARIGAWTLFAIMVIMFGFTVAHLVDQPGNPGWWTVAWFFAGAAFMIGGYIWDYVPRSREANALMITTWVLGVVAVPFAVDLFTGFNFVIMVVATVTVVPFAMAANHYSRKFALFREGYQV